MGFQYLKEVLEENYVWASNNIKEILKDIYGDIQFMTDFENNYWSIQQIKEILKKNFGGIQQINKGNIEKQLWGHPINKESIETK